jgi:hypothetical protein
VIERLLPEMAAAADVLVDPASRVLFIEPMTSCRENIFLSSISSRGVRIRCT